MVARRRRFEPVAGAPGELVGATPRPARRRPSPIAVVEVDPPKRFSFRWCFTRAGPAPGKSLLVTFDLVPTGGGTLVRMTETGFRELGWEVAVLEEQYHDHENGWDHYIPGSASTSRGWSRRHDARRSTTSCGRRSATRPGAR